MQTIYEIALSKLNKSIFRIINRNLQIKGLYNRKG